MQKKSDQTVFMFYNKNQMRGDKFKCKNPQIKQRQGQNVSKKQAQLH